MSEWSIGLIALVCVYAGALLGLGLQRLLPKHHLSSDSKDAVKLVTALLATLSALVLGLLIASAKSSFDAVSDALKQTFGKGDPYRSPTVRIRTRGEGRARATEARVCRELRLGLCGGPPG